MFVQNTHIQNFMLAINCCYYNFVIDLYLALFGCYSKSIAVTRHIVGFQEWKYLISCYLCYWSSSNLCLIYRDNVSAIILDKIPILTYLTCFWEGNLSTSMCNFGRGWGIIHWNWKKVINISLFPCNLHVSISCWNSFWSEELRALIIVDCVRTTIVAIA